MCTNYMYVTYSLLQGTYIPFCQISKHQKISCLVEVIFIAACSMLHTYLAFQKHCTLMQSDQKYKFGSVEAFTIKILSFRTDRHKQTVQIPVSGLIPRSTLIRIYTVCHSFYVFWMHCHHKNLYAKTTLFKF